MINPFETHGAVSWTELMTTDDAAAAEYYAQLFGWSFEDMPMPGDPSKKYRVFKPKGEERSIGGIMLKPEHLATVPPHWTQYVTVQDIAATIAKAKELGATLLMPEPMELPGVGKIMPIQDPQGAVIHAIEYAMNESSKA